MSEKPPSHVPGYKTSDRGHHDSAYPNMIGVQGTPQRGIFSYVVEEKPTGGHNPDTLHGPPITLGQGVSPQYQHPQGVPVGEPGPKDSDTRT